jgi:hypothetical protein
MKAHTQVRPNVSKTEERKSEKKKAPAPKTGAFEFLPEMADVKSAATA